LADVPDARRAGAFGDRPDEVVRLAFFFEGFARAMPKS
jgi:hypothetical protein